MDGGMGGGSSAVIPRSLSGTITESSQPAYVLASFVQTPGEHDPIRPLDPAHAVPHMSPEEFRRRGREVIDFIADYLATIETRDVRPSVKPGDVLALMPAHPPEKGEPWAHILGDAFAGDGPVMSGLTHWQHPMFFGYFPASTSYPAVLGDLLSSGLGVIGMLWATSPSCTEVEMRVMDWMAEAIGLPAAFTFSGSNGRGGGAIHGTASEATLAALVAGRYRVIRDRSPGDAARTTAYTSEQSHSSVIKAAMIAGLARDAADRSRIRVIPVDKTGAMRGDELRAAIESDLRQGLLPAFVCATLGTTGTGAVDDVAMIADAIESARAGRGDGVRPWLHVDAAYAGSAMICPEFAWMRGGLERADSFCFNPHKWLLTNFDCDCFWTSDRAGLTGSMSIQPSYLRNAASDSGAVVDYRDWHVPLGRRFRSLKLWFVMRHYGLEGLRAHVRRHVSLAELLDSWLDVSPRFERAAPRAFGLVCLRVRPWEGESREQTNARTRRVLETVNEARKALLVAAELPPAMLSAYGPEGSLAIRVSIGSPGVERRHIEDLWMQLETAADAVSSL